MKDSLVQLAVTFLLGWALCSMQPASGSPPADTSVKLGDPVEIAATKRDGTRLEGRMVSYDLAGFRLAMVGNRIVPVEWAALTPADVMNVFLRLLPRGTAEQWVRVGKLLLSLEGGRQAARGNGGWPSFGARLPRPCRDVWEKSV